MTTLFIILMIVGAVVVFTCTVICLAAVAMSSSISDQLDDD